MNMPALLKDAKLPTAYEDARNAIALVDRVDECQEWADKAAALASYARQAADDAMLNMARRIQLRAIERGGLLLQMIEAATNQHDARARDGHGPSSRKEAAEEAGISDRQRKTMLRVANVPEDERNALIERETPPTVTALADMGKKPAPPKATPKPYAGEWSDWTSAVNHLAEIPDCGLAPLADRMPEIAPMLLGEAEKAARNLQQWISVLEGKTNAHQ